MSIFKRLFGSVNELKESTDQKEIKNKINDAYESIAKGVEELNAKVNSLKELKEKLKNLPPPPPEPTKPPSSDVEKKSDEKPEIVPPPPPPPVAAPPKPATSSSSESDSGSGEKPNIPPPPAPPAFDLPPPAKTESTSSPLPMPGAAEATPRVIWEVLILMVVRNASHVQRQSERFPKIITILVVNVKSAKEHVKIKIKIK